ncbi:MaoC family dehydratase [Rhizobacter sp. Root404]|uniref:MaoC family dehydratase n=1 Tax=Rhizobacter sp. Root404 TaxID=1736528 RepID=UPI0009EBD852|nr:MaoC family dehydratase [Rhizobacter sp. Root404]
MTAARSPGDRAPPTVVGETFSLVVRLSDDEIRAGSRALHDLNPLHHELAAARAAGYPGLIASGAHTGAIFMGMTATHFSSPAPDGAPRSVLGLGFDIRFRNVVLADEDITFRWTVESSAWKGSLNGYVTRSIGEVRTARGLVLTGVANLLLRHA